MKRFPMKTGNERKEAKKGKEKKKKRKYVNPIIQ
jgi:hypothetical protein